MQLQLISDIHLEEEFTFKPIAKILALCGDIGDPFSTVFKNFIDWCAISFEHVLFVPGNHEYYNFETDKTLFETDKKLFEKTDKRLQEIFPVNVHLLNNKTFIIDQIGFIGSTLWTHIPDEHAPAIKNYINDYRFIKGLTPQIVTSEYKKNKKFIRNEIIRLSSLNITPVVLTHHVPSFYNTSAPMYRNKVTNYAFAVKINFEEDEIPPNTIRLWCAGHTHYNFHHSYEGYELISNQGGYRGEGVKNFDPEMVIEL